MRFYNENVLLHIERGCIIPRSVCPTFAPFVLGYFARTLGFIQTKLDGTFYDQEDVYTISRFCLTFFLNSDPFF